MKLDSEGTLQRIIVMANNLFYSDKGSSSLKNYSLYVMFIYRTQRNKSRNILGRCLGCQATYSNSK